MFGLHCVSSKLNKNLSFDYISRLTYIYYCNAYCILLYMQKQYNFVQTITIMICYDTIERLNYLFVMTNVKIRGINLFITKRVFSLVIVEILRLIITLTNLCYSSLLETKISQLNKFFVLFESGKRFCFQQHRHVQALY